MNWEWLTILEWHNEAMEYKTEEVRLQAAIMGARMA